MTTAQAKTLLNVSRKYLIPLLETFDRQRVTVRVGEARHARGAPAL
jgi:selenocysteine-specific elongation factor